MYQVEAALPWLMMERVCIRLSKCSSFYTPGALSFTMWEWTIESDDGDTAPLMPKSESHLNACSIGSAVEGDLESCG